MMKKYLNLQKNRSTSFCLKTVQNNINIFDTQEKADKVKRKCSGKKSVVSLAKAENKKENPPLLHILTSLQQEVNDIFGITAAYTLNSF